MAQARLDEERGTGDQQSYAPIRRSTCPGPNEPIRRERTSPSIPKPIKSTGAAASRRITSPSCAGSLTSESTTPDEPSNCSSDCGRAVATGLQTGEILADQTFDVASEYQYCKPADDVNGVQRQMWSTPRETCQPCPRITVSCFNGIGTHKWKQTKCRSSVVNSLYPERLSTIYVSLSIVALYDG